MHKIDLIEEEQYFDQNISYFFIKHKKCETLLKNNVICTLISNEYTVLYFSVYSHRNSHYFPGLLGIASPLRNLASELLYTHTGFYLAKGGFHFNTLGILSCISHQVAFANCVKIYVDI